VPGHYLGGGRFTDGVRMGAVELDCCPLSRWQGQGVGRKCGGSFVSDKAVVRPDFVPKESYVAEEFEKLERERLWPKVWLNACREEEIPDAGDFITFDIADQTILVVRQPDNSIRAFHNVCQHRGRRLKEGCGNTGRSIFCRFHGWRWKIDGSLEKVVWSEDWGGCPNFEDSDLALKSVKVESWAGAVWISMNPEAPPLREYLSPLPELLDPFEIENMRYVWYKTVTINCSWKVACDAFNEAYHSQATHAQMLKYGARKSGSRAVGPHGMFYFPDRGERNIAATAEPEPEAAIDMGETSPFARKFTGLDPRELIYRNIEESYRTLNALISEHAVRAAKRLLDEPEGLSQAELGLRLDALYREEMTSDGIQLPENLTPEVIAAAGTNWHIFPNTIVLPALNGVQWYRMRPNGVDANSCIFDVWCLQRFPPGRAPEFKHEVFAGPDEFRGQNLFLEQDLSNMEAVQQGMKSLGFRAARTNPVQEAAISNFHKAIRQYVLGE